MDTYAVGQVLYRVYVGKRGIYTVEFKMGRLHKGYVKITSESVAGEITPGREHEYTEAFTAIKNHFALTPIGALEKLRDRWEQDRIIQESGIRIVESNIRAITQVITDQK